MESVLPRMKDGRQAFFLFLPDGEDPDSLVQREGATVFAARLDTAQPLTDYLVERLRAQVNVNTDEGAARLMEQMEKEGVVGAPNHVGKREILGRSLDD